MADFWSRFKKSKIPVLKIDKQLNIQTDSLTPACNLIKYESIEYIYNALVLGLKDYALKNGFKKAALGLSGGIDSSLIVGLMDGQSDIPIPTFSVGFKEKG